MLLFLPCPSTLYSVGRGDLPSLDENASLGPPRILVVHALYTCRMEHLVSSAETEFKGTSRNDSTRASHFCSTHP